LQDSQELPTRKSKVQISNKTGPTEKPSLEDLDFEFGLV